MAHTWPAQARFGAFCQSELELVFYVESLISLFPVGKICIQQNGRLLGNEAYSAETGGQNRGAALR